MKRVLVALAVMLLVQPGWGGAQDRPVAADWRRLATTDDRRRLHDWREAFVKALGEARATNAEDVAREGKLLDPDAALDPVNLPDGSYRCRMVKLGSADGAGLSYVAYPHYQCVVVTLGGVTGLRKISGSQRVAGRLFEDGPTRRIFLGTMIYGDETSALRYGRDGDRDIAGAVERIDARRWRVIMPYPRFESVLDVVELVPLD